MDELVFAPKNKGEERVVRAIEWGQGVGVVEGEKVFAELTNDVMENAAGRIAHQWRLWGGWREKKKEDEE